MKKPLLTGLCLIVITITFGQVDSTSMNKSDFYSTLRIGIGIERNPFIEIGYSRLAIADKGLNSGSICFYAAGQVNRLFKESQSDYAYGGKIGFETAWMIGMWGAEIKYLTTEKASQLFVTPRIGLSLLGTTSLLYGINLPTKNNKLPEIGQHQISLTANLSRRLAKKLK